MTSSTSQPCIALADPEIPPVEVVDGHRTTRPVAPGVWPMTDVRCFSARGVIRIVPVRRKPYLRATCRIRHVEVGGRSLLESNLLEVGFWDDCEASFWQAQLCLSETEAEDCERDALGLVL